MSPPRLTWPARLGKGSSWAWHASTAIEFVFCFLGGSVLAGGYRPGAFLVSMAFFTVVVAQGGWKSARRQAHRTRLLLAKSRVRSRELEARCDELREANVALNSTLAPPVMLTYVVRGPVIWHAPEDEDDWPTVPLVFNGEHARDPAGQLWVSRVPPGAPWHNQN